MSGRPCLRDLGPSVGSSVGLGSIPTHRIIPTLNDLGGSFDSRRHRVPLSDAALAALERARVLEDGSGLIFPSPLRPGRSLSDMTLTKILRDRGLAERATVHGFRSAFRDWCAETGKPREIAEAALAHTVGGVEGAYFRSDLLVRRRVLMDQWAEFLEAPGGKVVRLYG